MQRNALIDVLKSFINSLPFKERMIFKALKQLIQSLNANQDEKAIFESADTLRNLLRDRSDFFDLKILLARHWSLNDRDTQTQKPIDIFSGDPLDIHNERDVIALSNGRVYARDTLENYFQNVCGYNQENQPQDDYRNPLTSEDKRHLQGKGIVFLTPLQIRNKKEQENLENLRQLMNEEVAQPAPFEEKAWIEENLLNFDRMPELWANLSPARMNQVRRNDVPIHPAPASPETSARATGAFIGRIIGSVLGLIACVCIGALHPAFLPVTWMLLVGTSLAAGGHALWRNWQQPPPAHLPRLGHFAQRAITTFATGIITVSLLSLLAGSTISLLASLSAISLTATMTAASILLAVQPCIPLALFTGAAIAEIFHQGAFQKTVNFVAGFPVNSIGWVFEKIGTGIGICVDACRRHFQRNQRPAPQPSPFAIANSDIEIQRALGHALLFSPAFGPNPPAGIVNGGGPYAANPFGAGNSPHSIWNAYQAGNRVSEDEREIYDAAAIFGLRRRQ